ncbi:MAG: hypothetical protein JW776_06910 [Candidatus Lokiarchaeota archaeon]|nr:hypothetical protein [Candidatus Lokiarchaeota archaeon]
MKITKRKTIKLRYTILTIVCFIPLVLFGAFGGFIGYLFTDLASHAFDRELNFYNPYDPDYPWNSMENITADLDLMDDLANTYQIRQIDYHTPINLSVNCWLYNNAVDPSGIFQYDLTDNAGLYTGASLATECFRYQTLTEPGERAVSLELIKKLTTGLSLLMAVPNGGLGPQFPGQTLARFYAMPDLVNDANYSYMFGDHYKMFNGTDGTAMGGEDYSQWRVRLYTSKDELGGYFFGLAAALQLCDDPWVQDVIKKIIGQIANGFIDSMYQEIHGDGNPCGAHLENMFTLTGEWKMILMKMALIAYPENQRYAQLYNYYCTREMYQPHSPHIGESNTVDEYYANGFGNNLLMGYALVEDDPIKLDRFINNYEAEFKLYRYQRNAQVNSIFLAFNALRSTPSTRYSQAELDEILWDTLDQLHQFTAYPIYNDSYGGVNKSVLRQDLGGTWTILDPKIQKWKNFFDTNPIGILFRWLPGELMDGMLDDRYLRPKTVSMKSIDTFIWNSNPYAPTDVWSHSRAVSWAVRERIGISYTMPYYILKYFGYLEGL